MLKWDSVFEWGRRASDRKAPAPVPPVRDQLLESIIAHEQVEVLYQPQIEPSSGRIAGAEALARSAITPSAQTLFARAAAAGLGERLSRLMQRKALRSAAVWEGPLKGLKLSINLLPEDISRDGYEQWLLDEVEANGMDPKRLTVEITESALLVDQPAVAERLSRLRDAGISIAIDDFGTGYASLAYLTTLPLDMIKIDRGLIADIVGGQRDRIVVRAMIRLARELDLAVAVEGVESTPQLQLLAEWGCDLYQGFLGAGALTEEELWRFVAAAQIQEVA
ncbi:MAG TPA: EAL domain-containing protein [Sphingomicrobium sp.]|jgi:EAL domain-containing protein (putative c-di-GMP-specific phosphodiesterase class I)|nr:EAL domain-containing protein [Sphingomicrobium sp.]